MAAKQLFTNNANTVMSGTLAIGGATLNVASGEGALFPSITGSDYFLLTIFTKDVYGTEENYEQVKVTARVGDSMTIERDYGGLVGVSGGRAYDGVSEDVFVRLRWTAEGAEGLQDYTDAVADITTTKVHAATSKATPVDADELSLVDSAASYVLKRLTWANLKATLWTSLGALIAAGTAKTAPVDGDGIAIADSAASSATKYLTLTNLWANLFKGKADALYAPIAKGVTNGDSHDHSGGDGAQIAYSGLSGLPTLGTAAVKNTGASGDAVPLCNVANTWAENQTFGKAAGFDAEISPSATTGAITVDWSTGNRCKFTPTGNCTLSFTAPGVRCKLTLIVTSGATPYTITQPGSTVAMGTAPSTVANKDTMYQYDWDGSEYRWMGVTEP